MTSGENGRNVILMADLVTNDTPLVDPHAFRFNRFSDGTKIVIDAGF